MRPSELVFYRMPLGWRWLVEAMWKLEHAFERAKVSDKGENDTRIRIFFVLVLFATGFVTLGVGRRDAARCSPTPDRGVAVAPAPASGCAPTWWTARATCWPWT